MYGLINRAIRALITREFGAEAWGKISETPGYSGADFAGMETYPNEVTYALVGAASETLDIPADRLLHTFGTFWTSYASEAGYLELLDMTGDSFEEFVSQLDDLHARIALIFPDLQPPSFEFEELDTGHGLLHYYTERPGLAPMVHGLLESLADRFSISVDIELRNQEESDGHDIFELRGYAA